MHAVHTCTVAFRQTVHNVHTNTVLIKCDLLLSPLMRTLHDWLKRTIHVILWQTFVIFHHGGAALVVLSGARGESLRPESAEFRGLTLGYVSTWRKLAVRSSAVNEFSGPGDCTVTPGGARVEPHPEEERWRRWSKLCVKFNKNSSQFELKLLHEFRCQEQYM